MAKLHLGVDDIPYPEERPRDARGRFSKGPMRNMTTGRLADILEVRYAILGNFSSMYGEEITEAFASDIDSRIEALLADEPDPGYANTGEAIEGLFHNFIYNRELDGVVEGVPTEAAEKGRSSRPKFRKYPPGVARPSFVDTGLYEKSFRAWVEET